MEEDFDEFVNQNEDSQQQASWPQSQFDSALGSNLMA